MAGKEYRVALGAQQGNLIRKVGRLQNKSGNGNFTPATLFLNFRKLSDMFKTQTYTRRRNELRKRLGGGLILLPGNHESSANYPGNTFPFRQDSTFLYFFGLNHPGYAGVLDADSGEDMLFGEDYTIDDIIWMGPQPSLADQALKAGVTLTAGLNELAETIRTAIAAGRRIHFLPPYRGETTLMLSDLLGIRPDALAQYVSVPLAKTVVALREIKDAEEIAEIERACTIGTKMHLQVMQMCRPGVVEQEIAGAIDGIALQYGAGVSFMSIVSQNGETLHNHYHGNVLEGGRLLLVDAGAETNMNYCSDFTRTIPVNGKFTVRQKDIYDIVLAANSRTFELARPGAFYWQMHNAAARIIADGLKELGLMQGDMEAAVACGAQALFMPHGLGHQMGLDVHDMENIGEKYVGYDDETLRSETPGLSSLRMGKRLAPGMVMTVEPGIYFIPALVEKWEKEGLGGGFINFAKVREYFGFGGIRIEDDMLITPEGNRMLGNRRAPATTNDIETFMHL